MLERGRLETRKDERRLDGFECRAGWQACTRGSFTGKGELFRGRLRGSRLGWRVQDVLNGRDPGDGFFGEDAQLQRKGPGKFAVEIDGAAAHSGDHACVLNLGPFQLNQNDGLLRAQEIVQNSDDFQVELFYLIPGKDRVGVTLHSGAHLAERENLAQFLSGRSLRSQAQGEGEREKGEE